MGLAKCAAVALLLKREGYQGDAMFVIEYVIHGGNKIGSVLPIWVGWFFLPGKDCCLHV